MPPSECVPLVTPRAVPDALHWRWEADQWVQQRRATTNDDDDAYNSAPAEVLSVYASHAVVDDNKNTVYTLTAVGTPRRLALAQCSNNAAPTVTYFDLALDDVIRTAVHVVDNSDDDGDDNLTTLRIALVQCAGTIWYWNVRVDEENQDNAVTPATALQSLHLPDAFDGDGTPIWLRRSAVVPLNASMWLVAWTPWLLAVDLDAPDQHYTTTMWSASLTADRRRSGTTMRRLLTYIAGADNDDAYRIQDMQAVLTLAVAPGNINNNNNITTVYSWHDDGVLRQWTLPVNSTQPTAVTERALVANEQLPLHFCEGAVLAASPKAVALSATTGDDTTIYVVSQEDQDTVRLFTVPALAQITAWQWTHQGTALHVLWRLENDTNNTPVYQEWVYNEYDGEVRSTTLWSRPVAPIIEYSVDEDEMEEEERADALQAVDAFYLTRLLRPTRVRDTGTVLPPTAALIRQALHQVTRSTPASNTTSSSSSSIAAEIVTSLHAWRQALEHSRQRTPGRPMFGHTTALLPQRSVHQVVQDHVACWKKLLHKIHQLEGLSRTILHVHWLDHGALVWRGQGDTSVVTRGHAPPVVHGVVGLLDNAATRLLAAVDDAAAPALAALEDGVERALRSGQLALQPVATLDALQAGLDDLDEDRPLWNETILPPAVAKQIMEADWTEHMEALQRLPWAYALPGLTLLPAKDEDEVAMDESSDGNASSWENIHWRLATLSLTMTSLDSYRRLTLGRYMVLKYLGISPAVAKVALWGYLQALSLLMTCAQYVPLPLRAPTWTLPPLGGSESSSSSPPIKRPSMDSQIPSFLEALWSVTEKTTVLDAYFLGVARHNLSSTSETAGLASFPILATQAILQGLCALDQADESLPELNILRYSPHKEPMEFPRFALWLLSAAFCVKDDTREQRRSALAQCLLSLAENEINESHGTAMAERAFELMRFNPHEMEVGVSRIIKLHRYVGSQSRFLENVLYLVEQAVHECMSIYTNDIWTKDGFCTLLSMYFAAAIGARKWKTASTAAILQPDPITRSEHLRRLVRHMVDNGALADLVKVCALSSDPMSDTRLKGIDMYATAMATLSGVAPRDSYVQSLTSQEPLSDHQSALFCLHLTNQEWKRAAEALDQRYIHARDALIQGNDEVSGEQARQRERLAVQDMSLSAMGRAAALNLIQDANDAYMLKDQTASYPTLPLKLLNDMSPNRVKRMCEALQGTESFSDSSPNKSKKKKFIFLHCADVNLVAVRSVSFQVLLAADKIAANQAKNFLREPVTVQRDFLLVKELFKHGFYPQGMTLGKAMRDAQRGKLLHGSDVLNDVATHLACECLVPLLCGKKGFPVPETQRLMDSLYAFASGEHPTVPLFPKPVKNADASSNFIRQLAGEILRHVTTEYTTSASPLAIRVADCLISDDKYGPAPLPEWLHSLLVHGTPTVGSPSLGLFAKHSSGEQPFSGDPSYLLSAYTEQGMYEEACRVVTEALAVDDQSPLAANRLPEMGDVYFVPYSKIDMLNNLITVSVDRGMYNTEHTARLAQAQEDLQNTLSRHFELLKVSELGLKSARALSRS